jgi:hypothetical protein
MNREQVKKIMPVIQAFANGDAIQRKRPQDGEWEDIFGLWLYGDCEYRIKPNPVECWVNVGVGDMVLGTTWDTESEAKESAERIRGAIKGDRVRTIRMREVTE